MFRKRNGDSSCYSCVVPDQQHQDQLGSCLKWKFTSSTLDLLNLRGSATSTSTSPLGASDAHQSCWATGMSGYLTSHFHIYLLIFKWYRLLTVHVQKVVCDFWASVHLFHWELNLQVLQYTNKHILPLLNLTWCIKMFVRTTCILGHSFLDSNNFMYL